MNNKIDHMKRLCPTSNQSPWSAFVATLRSTAVGLLVLFCIAVASPQARAQSPSVTPGPGDPVIDMAATAMDLWKDTGDAKSARWTYDEGVVWKGLEGLWLNTGDARYYKYIQHQVDRLVDKEGNIATYKLDDYNLDNVL